MSLFPQSSMRAFAVDALGSLEWCNKHKHDYHYRSDESLQVTANAWSFINITTTIIIITKQITSTASPRRETLHRRHRNTIPKRAMAVSGDLWNGDVGKLERGTSSERRLDLSPGAHHHGLAAMAALLPEAPLPSCRTRFSICTITDSEFSWAKRITTSRDAVFVLVTKVFALACIDWFIGRATERQDRPARVLHTYDGWTDSPI
ncbi:hypothetical protein J7T55_006381 [Diaporthe amygdali]|uniref:uncharacterized protein n=1 Tax=Phomopsis amygdali TaxID=1214568 RepID=UPI0022FE8D7A|nr:uncharacterized protein J7T55_006381 [Diaporthe amygdali]KAJ0125037.1 hypothetical protein J7T55_006381 [Diaporthe amygdali]